ncbi:N-acetyltransferase [Candidatus Microgenomates bacterium]|nr:N-acetyltransferase [Candidatus Microgenomates bacterium]
MMFNNRFTIGKNVILGKNVRIGDNTVLYDNVVIQDNTVVANNCVIGEPCEAYYSDTSYNNPQTVIGEGSFIRSHTIIYAGSTFGPGFTTGHRAIIRENVRMGSHCSIGTQSDIQNDCLFGDYCRIHSGAFICPQAILGNFVLVFPQAIFTSDPTPPSNFCQAPQVGDYSVIAAGALLMPGVKIGSQCVIAAGSIVTHDVLDYSLMLGSPAKKHADVRDVHSRETGHKHHYPWMERFDRGMPWKGMGYKTWIKNQMNAPE